MRTALGVVLLVGSWSCGAPDSGAPKGSSQGGVRVAGSAVAPESAASASSASSTSSSAPTATSSAAAPPPVERSCTSDGDCAVARIEVSGAHVCCDACATTPGTRRWHADLQHFCGSHAAEDCSPLACPQGPTRAVCRAGKCEATPDAKDGTPASVNVERRCLPAMVCDTWEGCALVKGNNQDGWFVDHTTSKGSRGDLASVDNVCTAVARGCEAARLHLRGVTCPVHSVLPAIAPPAYSCTLAGGRCRQSP